TAQPHLGLLDCNYGQWQGLTPDEVAARYPDLFQRWLNEPALATFPGGESLAIAQKRVVGALESIIAHHPDETVVLVGHQGLNKVLLCAVLGLDLNHYWDLRQDNCSLNIFCSRDTGG